MTVSFADIAPPPLDLDQARRFMAVLHGPGNGAGQVVFTFLKTGRRALQTSGDAWNIDDGLRRSSSTAGTPTSPPAGSVPTASRPTAGESGMSA